MRYFVHFASHNQPKNKLQHEAAALLEEDANKITYDAKGFEQRFRTEIDKLNHAYPNCTPLKVSTYGHGGTISFSLGEHFTVGFHLYPINEGGAA